MTTKWTFSATVEVTGDVSIEALSLEDAIAKFENDPMSYMTVEYETVIATYTDDDDGDEVE